MTIAYFQRNLSVTVATFSQGKGLRPGPCSFSAAWPGRPRVRKGPGKGVRDGGRADRERGARREGRGVVGATDLGAVGGGRTSWVDLRHRGRGA